MRCAEGPDFSLLYRLSRNREGLAYLIACERCRETRFCMFFRLSRNREGLAHHALFGINVTEDPVKISISIINPLLLLLKMQSTTGSSSTPSEKPTFIRGRTVNSLNVIYQGFRYSKDGKPTISGRQSWRCVLKKYKCPGRLYTLGDSICDTPRPHSHPANFIDAEVKTIYSRAKDLRISSNNPPALILNAVKRGASDAALLHLPKPTSFKRALNKTKAAENPTPKAPSSLAEL